MNMPMSALLHTLLVDLFPLYLFYYSCYTVLGALHKGLALTDVQKKCKEGADYCPPGSIFAAEYASSKCLTRTTQAELWNNKAERTDAVNCLMNKTVDNPPPLEEDHANEMNIMAMFNLGAFTMCLAIWCAVLVLFFYHNNWAAKVRDGAYFQNSFLMRRTRLYRYLCGLLTLCIGVTVAFIILALAMSDEWSVLREIVPSMIAAAVTVKPILRPKKPKFDYSKLSGKSFERGSFFTTNASFASSFGDALMQAHRGFKDKLAEKLANPKDWEEILEMCAVKSDSTSDNVAHKVSGLAHKVKGAWEAHETKQPDTDK